MTFWLLLGVGFLALSEPVQAGILTNIANTLLGSKPLDLSAKTNSQTVALLAAEQSPNPKASGIGGGDTTIVGGEALLPDSGPLGTIADIPTIPKGDQISLYVVREGDTLSSIAKLFDVSVNTIMWANNLKKGQALKKGDTLTILPISGVSHTVAKGDTVKSIAKRYHADIDEIVQFNDLNDEGTLAVGDIVIVPDGEIVASPSKPSVGTTAVSATPTYSGYYLRPIAGGRRTQGLHGYRYNAVDLATSFGAPIFAAADGVVILSRTGGWNGGYGNYVVVQHPNGTQTLYAHNSENLVGVGERVERGQTIAKVGLSGKTTGAHVHFEIRGAKNPF